MTPEQIMAAAFADEIEKIAMRGKRLAQFGRQRLFAQAKRTGTEAAQEGGESALRKLVPGGMARPGWNPRGTHTVPRGGQLETRRGALSPAQVQRIRAAMPSA
jgi:hypothetical protein